MVADNSKQSVNENTTTGVVEVGDGGSTNSGTGILSRRPKFGKKNFLIAIVLLAVLIVAGLVAKDSLHLGEKVYAQAAGHKIYKEDIEKLIGGVPGLKMKDGATVLANKYLYEAMAKEGGLTVTNKDISAKNPDYNRANKYVRQLDTNMAYYDKLQAYNSGLYKGELLVTNFSRNIAFQSPFIGIQQATNPLLGNKAAIAKDKKYAHDLITKLYNQVKNKNITFDQAIKMEHKDSQVGEDAYQTLPHSGPFDTSNIFMPGSALLAPKSIQSKLAKMKAGELSEPFPVRVSNAWKNPKITTESYYLVVRMDYTKGSHSGLSFDQYLANAKKQYDYKINI